MMLFTFGQIVEYLVFVPIIRAAIHIIHMAKLPARAHELIIVFIAYLRRMLHIEELLFDSDLRLSFRQIV